MSGRRLLVAIVLPCGLLLASACDTSPRDASKPATTTSTTTTTTTTTTITTTTGPDGLPALTVAPVSHRESYERDEFGDGWRDADGDCLNTRAEVLIAESTVRPTVSG